MDQAGPDQPSGMRFPACPEAVDRLCDAFERQWNAGETAQGPDPAVLYTNLGAAHMELGHAVEGGRSLTKAMQLWQAIAEASPSDIDAQRELAWSQDNLANYEFQAGHFDVALDHLNKSIEIWQKRAQQHPARANYGRLAAEGYAKAATIQSQKGDRDAALRSKEQELELLQRILGADDDE
jgi:tetratricopeptide (TPR) repeat protein